MPEATADASPPNAGCPRCGAAFHCGARESSCDCTGIELDAATLAALRDGYPGCLCPTCLRTLAAPPHQ
jgi:hypothetical protein